MAINIPILSSLNAEGFEKAARQFAQLKTNGEKANFALKKAVLPAVAALGTLATFGFKATQSASSFNEEISKSKAIFGSGADAVAKFSKTAATELGQSQQEAMAAASTFGIMGKAANLTGADLSTFSTDLVTLSTDLASFNNANPQDVVNALGSALRGEAEPMRKYGVLLNDAALKSEAMKLGIFNGNGALDAQQKILAANSLIFAQTSIQQGDFAKTSGGAAAQQKILAAQFKDVQQKIGQFLLPALDAALKVLSIFATWATDNTQVFLIVGGVIGGLAVAILAVNYAIKIWTATTKAFTAVQTLFNAAMAANPVGLIVVAIGLFVAALVIAYKKFEGFRDIINSGLNIAIGAFETFTNAVISALNYISGAINKFTGLFSKIGINIGKIGEIGKVEFGRIGDSVEMTRGHLLRLDDDVKIVKETADDLVPSLGDVSTGLGKVSGASKKTEDQTKKTTDALKKLTIETYKAFAAEKAKKTAAALAILTTETERLRAAETARIEALETGYETALNGAKDFLTAAKKDFADFASGISGAITGAFSFTDAIESGKESGKGFIEGLRIQANEAGQFGERIALLVARGLSGPALDQVVKAGAKAGTVIADELLNTVGGIDVANQLTADVQGVADRVGALAAVRFKQAGIDNAEAYISGVQATIDRYKLAATYVGTDAGTAGRFAADIAGLASIYGGLTAMASGGIVTSPTMALIGESGPEAVIPLGSGGGLGNTYNISVDAGIAGNPVEIGQQIVTAISKYERSAGTNWRS